MSALRPVADTLNRIVRSLLTPPERRFFKPAPLLVSCNPLNYLDSDIRTKMAVVRLRRRKWAERHRKQPEMGLAAAARGSDKWPEKPTSCGFPTADQERKKNVPTRATGGGRGARPETFSTFEHTRVADGARGEILSAGRGSPAGPYG